MILRSIKRTHLTLIVTNKREISKMNASYSIMGQRHFQLKDHLSLDFIARYTGLPFSEIEALQAVQ